MGSSGLSLNVDLDQRDPARLADVFNNLPCFAGSGGRITFISDDLMTVKVIVPLTASTRNVVGSIYGGSMYAATDAVYLTMLWFQLGSDYMLLDRASRVEYLRPGLADVNACCTLDEEVVRDVKATLAEKVSCSRDFLIEFKDARNKVVCRIEKTVYIRRATAAGH